jgi:phage terminase large subunit-like protein
MVAVGESDSTAENQCSPSHSPPRALLVGTPTAQMTTASSKQAGTRILASGTSGREAYLSEHGLQDARVVRKALPAGVSVSASAARPDLVCQVD